MSNSAFFTLGLMSLAMFVLSAWWTLRALDRGEINIGKSSPIWLRRRDAPVWFWFWMSLYFVSVAMFAAFAVVFLTIAPGV